MQRPTISLSYAAKNDDLMMEFGQQQYCHHIETFDPDKLVLEVQTISANFQSIKTQIEEHTAIAKKQLFEQHKLLLQKVLSIPPNNLPEAITPENRGVTPDVGV